MLKSSLIFQDDTNMIRNVLCQDGNSSIRSTNRRVLIKQCKVNRKMQIFMKKEWQKTVKDIILF